MDWFPVKLQTKRFAPGWWKWTASVLTYALNVGVWIGLAFGIAFGLHLGWTR